MTVERADAAFRAAMLAAGFTADEASRADVHGLASGVLRVAHAD